MARQTSIKAYNQIKEEGLLNKLRFEVYDKLFKNGPMTQGETWINHFKSRQRHDIAPRFAELENREVIKCVGKRPCNVTGRECLVYDVTKNIPKENIKSKKEKLIAKIKKIERQLFKAKKQLRLLDNSSQGKFKLNH